MEAQQHEILSNFDTFLKIAGSELGSLRSVARYNLLTNPDTFFVDRFHAPLSLYRVKDHQVCLTLPPISEAITRNITESGSDVNLWEILAAVNSTVRKNPDSSIAQLMTKFEEKYLADDGSMSAIHPAEAVYERSLSSLLFLSMGIFLLNSVNELVQSGNLPAGQAR